MMKMGIGLLENNSSIVQLSLCETTIKRCILGDLFTEVRIEWDMRE
jgi:hypothetical protein